MKTYLFPIALFALLVVGCKKDPEPEASINDNTDLSCQLLNISSTFDYEDEYSSSDGSSSVEFSYNDDKTVNKIHSHFTEVYCYIYNEAEECENYESTDELMFTYSNGLLTDVISMEEDDDESFQIDLTYEDNRLSKIQFSEVGDTYLDEYVFVYNTDGRLIKLENWDNHSASADDMVLYGYDEYLWTGNNVTTVNSYYDSFDESSSRTSKLSNKTIFGIRKAKQSSNQMRVESVVPELSYKITMTYDSKSNPFFGNLPLLLWNGDFHTHLSANNPISINLTDYDDDNAVEENETYSYTYNADGFPTVVNNDRDETVLTYSCD